jgi:hypothetical protein
MKRPTRRRRNSAHLLLALLATGCLVIAITGVPLYVRQMLGDRHCVRIHLVAGRTEIAVAILKTNDAALASVAGELQEEGFVMRTAIPKMWSRYNTDLEPPAFWGAGWCEPCVVASHGAAGFLATIEVTYLRVPLPVVGALLGILPALAAYRGPIKRWRRRRRGRCICCGYDLTGNVSGICPECGNPLVTPKEP